MTETTPSTHLGGTPIVSLPRPTGTAVSAAVTIQPATPVPVLAEKSAFDAFVGSALLPALVAAAVALAVAASKNRREEQARVRKCLAEAYQAYTDYKEFPYAIRRRNAADPGGERVRVSEDIRKVQSSLSYHQTWTRVEAAELGDAYNALVDEARKVVGGAMRLAWTESPVDSDSAMNMGLDIINLTSLATLEKAFLEAAKAHVDDVGRGWISRAWRSVRGMG